MRPRFRFGSREESRLLDPSTARAPRMATPLPHQALQSNHAGSFDYLVSAGEQRRRYFEVERSCSLEINHKFKLGRLHDRQASPTPSLEKAAGEDTDLTIDLPK